MPDLKAKLPSAMQSGVSADAYQKLSRNPQCARLYGECAQPCEPIIDGEYSVELDHIVPLSEGGTNNLDNLQWLCACKNREKYNKSDVRYSHHCYFDNEIEPKNLREHQFRLAYGLALAEYKELFETPTRLIDHFMLLAWMVGAGKTIGMLSILFAINKIRKTLGNGSARRIKKVLWLVHQKSLVTSLRKEIESELTTHGIAERNPSVVEVTDPSAWEYAGDIIIACPQALWDVRNRTIVREDTRARILNQFDVIIVDEAQFAIEHYLDLARLAPQAFKFAVTATPMNAQGSLFCEMDGGKYKDNFVLYSAFGYTEGEKAGLYKKLPPFKEGIDKYYYAHSGGKATIKNGDEVYTEDNTKEKNNLCRMLALIRFARQKAKSVSVRIGYDIHVMVRVGSILEAKSLEKALEEDGDVCAVYSGARGPHLGSENHPWNLVKANNGKLAPGSKRLVLAIDIGQFGINNRYCSMIVWGEPNLSLIEIVQRIGRAIRPTGAKNEYVRLVYNVGDGFEKRLAEAIEYIRESLTRMSAFRSMHELAEDVPDISPSIVVSPVSADDRVLGAHLLSQALAQGVEDDNAVKVAVEQFVSARPFATEKYVEKVQRFVTSQLEEEGRRQVIGIPGIEEKSKIVLAEEAPKEYTVAALAQAVENCEVDELIGQSEIDIKNMSNRLSDGDETLINLVKTWLKRRDEKDRELASVGYYDPGLIVRASKLDNLPFISFAQELMGMFRESWSNAGAPGGKLFRVSCQACYGALKHHYGLPNCHVKTFKKQKIEKQLSAAMMREPERRMIMRKAVAIFIAHEKDHLPDLFELYKGSLPDYALTPK